MSLATKKIGEIQGLRALAALLVLFYHVKLIPGGFVGVDIFYVISGYLITGLLIKELRSTGRISLTAFYLKRSKRLLPASFSVIFVTALFALLFLPSVARGSIGRDLIATSLYVSNYSFGWWQNDYQNLNALPSPFLHYWSLAVEEQFYLIWPLILIFLARGKLSSNRFNVKKLTYGILLISLSSFALGLWLTQSAPIWAFYSLPSRAWELGIGALLAIAPILQIRSKYLTYLGALGIFSSSIYFNETTIFPGWFALLPVVATALLISSIGAWPKPIHLLATNKVALWLGRISYPLYLWHWPLLVLPVAVLSRELSLFERVAALLVTVVLSDLTTRYLEEPLRIKEIAPKLAISTISVVMVLAITAGVGIMRSTTSAILIDGKQVTLASIESRPTPYDDGCHLNYQESISPLCEFGVLDSAKTVVLYGDSHAVQWFPALEKLAKEKEFRLINLTKSACPSIEVVRQSVGAFKMSNCASWRTQAIDRIRAEKPDLIILSSFEHFIPEGDPKKVNKWWQAGSLLTYELLSPLSKTIIYLQDTPLPTRNIPECLVSTKAENCFASSDLGLKQVANFMVINPAQWLCTEKCFAIVRGNVAYRDASHISVATSLELADRLWGAMLKSGFSL